MTGNLISIVCIQATNIHALTFLAGSYIGSTLPDIDHDLPLRHRGQTHSLFAFFIIFFIYLYTQELIILGLSIGYFTHIFIDMFNGKGTEILWPVTDKNYHFLDMKYSGVGEKVIFNTSMILSIVIITYQVWGGWFAWLKFLLQLKL